MIVVSLLAWLGFAASLVINIGSWFDYAPWGEAAFVFHFACIALMFLVTALRGGFKRKLEWADCDGLARPLLTIVQPYAVALFAWQMFGHHDKHQDLWVTLRLFSSIWMTLFLFAAGVMAGPRRS